MPQLKLTAFEDGRDTQPITLDYDTSYSLHGGQGRVYPIQDGDWAGYCVKAMRLPLAQIQAQRDVVTSLRNRVSDEIRLEKDRVRLARLHSLASMTPSYYGHSFENGSHVLFLLREFSPGEPLSTIPQLETSFFDRYVVARQCLFVLMLLDKWGYIHLDCYPDNAFWYDDDEGIQVDLIDFEGMGLRVNGGADSFVHSPTVFGKEQAFWILPKWFPRPAEGIRRPCKDFFVPGARWQALSLAYYILSGGGLPFEWLPRHRWLDLAQACRSPAASPDLDSRALKALADPANSDLTRLAAARARFENRSSLFDDFVDELTNTLLDPASAPAPEVVYRAIGAARNNEAQRP